jgi:hypothetical protein
MQNFHRLVGACGIRRCAKLSRNFQHMQLPRLARRRLGAAPAPPNAAHEARDSVVHFFRRIRPGDGDEGLLRCGPPLGEAALDIVQLACGKRDLQPLEPHEHYIQVASPACGPPDPCESAAHFSRAAGRQTLAERSNRGHGPSAGDAKLVHEFSVLVRRARRRREALRHELESRGNSEGSRPREQVIRADADKPFAGLCWSFVGH